MYAARSQPPSRMSPPSIPSNPHPTPTINFLCPQPPTAPPHTVLLAFSWAVFCTKATIVNCQQPSYAVVRPLDPQVPGLSQGSSSQQPSFIQRAPLSLSLSPLT
eukprot:scaffold13671_cov29-Tisochrysis_lutea.AAC.3